MGTTDESSAAIGTPVGVQVVNERKPERWFHPLSAVIMIACDFTGAIGDLAGSVLWVVMVFSIAGIFITSTTAIFLVQFFLEREGWKVALAKAVTAGTLCAIPMPIFGTAVGSYVLIRSGLNEGLPKVVKKFFRR